MEYTNAHDRILLAPARAIHDHGLNEVLYTNYEFTWNLKKSRCIVFRAGFRVWELSEKFYIRFVYAGGV